jgi:two-component system chemotaxis sensor kinase CheA
MLELSDHARSEGPGRAGRLSVGMIERRGKALPVVGLGQLLRLRSASEARKALVVCRNGELLAFAVDRMLGRQDVVVRPIEDTLARAPGIAGATDLGDGRPTMLLDLIELGASVTTWREAPSS